MIPYGRQKISTEDIKAVTEVLESDLITQGPRIDEFESQVASYCGSRHAIAVCNGTAGLHLAMLALGVKPGDSVLVPSLTFLASVNCIEYAGGRPVFVDIDPKTYNLDPNQVESYLKKNRAPKAIIAVDFAGLPAPLQDLKSLSEKYGIKIVEDACHALGSDQKNQNRWVKTGSGPFSDITVFSFHPVKHITTGEGGMLLTNDSDLHDKMKTLRSHGMRRGVSTKRPWYYEMEEPGYNYRITDVQCALGISQFRNIDSWVDRRKEIARTYTKMLEECGLQLPVHETGYSRSSFHLYVIQVPNRDSLFLRLRDQGIGTQVHYIPVHLQPYYRNKYGTHLGQLPVTEAYFEKCLSLPCFVDLSLEQCREIGEMIKQSGISDHETDDETKNFYSR